jgi:hypothetical protein
VSPSARDRQIALLVRDNPFDTVMAERLLGQAIADLITAMEKWGQGPGAADGTVERTARVVEANGFPVDWPLWRADFSKCSPCYPGSNSH